MTVELGVFELLGRAVQLERGALADLVLDRRAGRPLVGLFVTNRGLQRIESGMRQKLKIWAMIGKGAVVAVAVAATVVTIIVVKDALSTSSQPR